MEERNNFILFQTVSWTRRFYEPDDPLQWNHHRISYDRTKYEIQNVDSIFCALLPLVCCDDKIQIFSIAFFVSVSSVVLLQKPKTEYKLLTVYIAYHYSTALSQ